MGKKSEKKSEDEIFFDNAYNKSLKLGRYFSKDQYLAEEIAQITTNKLFYRKDQIRDYDKWLYQVVRNTAIQLIKAKHRTSEFKEEIKIDSELDNLPELVNHPKLEGVIQCLPAEFFTQEEKSIAYDYFCDNLKKNEIADKYDIDESDLYEKLYHLRQELILFLKLTGDFVLINNISGTRLNRNIKNFLKKLFNCIEVKDYSGIAKYTDNIDSFKVFNNIPKFEKLNGFEIQKHSDSQLELIINYKYHSKELYFLYLKFKIKHFKKVDYVYEPSLPDQMFRISSSDIGKLKDIILKRKTNGQFYCREKDIEELVKEVDAVDLMKNNDKCKK